MSHALDAQLNGENNSGKKCVHGTRPILRHRSTSYRTIVCITGSARRPLPAAESTVVPAVHAAAEPASEPAAAAAPTAAEPALQLASKPESAVASLARQGAEAEQPVIGEVVEASMRRRTAGETAGLDGRASLASLADTMPLSIS